MEGLPSTTVSGCVIELLTGTVTECRCGWIMVTQLHGESRCSLRRGHVGEHSFSAER